MQNHVNTRDGRLLPSIQLKTRERPTLLSLSVCLPACMLVCLPVCLSCPSIVPSYLRVRLGVLDEVENDPRRLLRPAALASGRHEGVLVLVAGHLIFVLFVDFLKASARYANRALFLQLYVKTFFDSVVWYTADSLGSKGGAGRRKKQEICSR